jgi:uncharacterized membrane protein YccC
MKEQQVHWLWRQRSPLVGWFCLMEVVSAGCIVGLWVEWLKPPPWYPQWKPYGTILTTFLFVMANILLFRRRRAPAGLAFIACFFLLLLLILPVL